MRSTGPEVRADSPAPRPRPRAAWSRAAAWGRVSRSRAAAWGRRSWLTGWLVAVAVALPVLVIGPPLWGAGVFAATDYLLGMPHSIWLSDTINAAIPQADLFGTALRHGHWLWWNPYLVGGVPLAATPSLALLSPLSLPYWILPGWLAPAWVKLLEIGCSVGGCFLYLRRIRLSRPAALVGGLVFATSGYMIMWTNWPQTRVAAFIPALFWAVERLVQRRRAWDAALIALVVAAMLFGGFPSVTGYALLTAGPYALVRAVVAYPRRPARLVGVLAGGIAGLAGGAALAAVQLVPFWAYLQHAHIVGRQQGSDSNLSVATLLTIVAPWALGTGNPGRPPAFFYTAAPAANNTNLVETMAYVGAAALVLVVYAATRLRDARRAVPPGVAVFTLAALALWLWICYVPGFPHSVLVHAPVFDINFVGRARSITGFLFAVLAALGFHLLTAAPTRAPAPGRWWRSLSAGSVTAAPTRAPAPGRWWRAIVAWVVRLAVAGALVGLWYTGRWTARHAMVPGDVALRVRTLDRQVLDAAALLALATGLVVVARVAGPRGRAVAGVVLPLLVVGQALTITTPYLPRQPRSSYYPTSDVTGYLAAHLGTDRMATGRGLLSGVQSRYRLRALDGHAYTDAKLADLLLAIPNFGIVNNTSVVFEPVLDQAGSPVLDRLAVRYFVTPPSASVFGTRSVPLVANGSRQLVPGEAVTVAVPGTGPLRAVTLTLAGRVPDGTVLSAELLDPGGRSVASGQWRAYPYLPNPTADGASVSVDVPLAAEGVPAGEPLSVRLSSSAPIRLGTVAPAAIGLGVVRPAADRLRLVLSGTAVVYQRLTALPRIRWAARAETVAAPAARIAAVADGRVPADTVLLSAPGPAADGRTARVRVLADQPDSLRVAVDADGAGYLVVADTLQVGWAATLDGHPAQLRAADHALVTVAVPAGTHVVFLRYTAPAGNAGGWISLGAVLLVLFVGAASARSGWRARRRIHKPRTTRGNRDDHNDPAGDGVRRTVPAAVGGAAAGRDRRTALLQRGRPHPRGNRADHPRP